MTKINPQNDVINYYIKGKEFFDEAETVWLRAKNNYTTDNWNTAAREFQFAQSKYSASANKFRQLLTLELSKESTEHANNAYKHTKLMSRAALKFGQSASSYGFGNADQVDMNYNQAQEALEEAQKIPEPVPVTTFRRSLRLDLFY